MDKTNDRCILHKKLAAASAERRVPLGPPPLLLGEDSAAYDELMLQVSAAIKPRDFIEEMWVDDFVNRSQATISITRRLSRARIAAER